MHRRGAGSAAGGGGGWSAAGVTSKEVVSVEASTEAVSREVKTTDA